MEHIHRAERGSVGGSVSGTLHLRPPSGSISGRLSWPVARGAARYGRAGRPVVLLVGPAWFDGGDRQAYATALAEQAGAYVLELPWRYQDLLDELRLRRPRDTDGKPEVRDAVLRNAQVALDASAYALRWLADHAGELGVDPAALIVVGCGEGCRAAAALARRARDDGWPELAGHVLVFPDRDVATEPYGPEGDASAADASPAQVSDCCAVLRAGGPAEPPYLSLLRAAGVPVRVRRLAVPASFAATAAAVVDAVITSAGVITGGNGRTGMRPSGNAFRLAPAPP